jgi:hypothetical protein
MPSRTIRSVSSASGADLRGKPARIDAMPFAWISAPGICALDTGVGNTSFSIGSVEPTITSLPRNAVAGTRPWSTSTSE